MCILKVRLTLPARKRTDIQNHGNPSVMNRHLPHINDSPDSLLSHLAPEHTRDIHTFVSSDNWTIFGTDEDASSRTKISRHSQKTFDLDCSRLGKYRVPITNSIRERSAHAVLPSRDRVSDMAAAEGKLAMRPRPDSRWAAFQQLFAGVAAGVATAICTHPLDLIKTRMQSPKPLASFFFSVRVFGRRLIGS